MALIASGTSKSKKFEIVPQGNHLARCYQLIDLGKQPTDWKGKPGTAHHVLVYFEVHSEDSNGKPTATPEGKPMMVTKRYTVSLTEGSHLRADLRGWRGREFTQEEIEKFELKNILGQWAMLSILHNESKGTTYANIDTITQVSAAVRKAGLPDPYNELVIFDVDEPDMEVFNKLSVGLQDKIKASVEWKAKFGNFNPNQTQHGKPMHADSDMDEDIPF
jgi:hypothetical protein